MTIQAQLGPKRSTGRQERGVRKSLRLTTSGVIGKRGTSEVRIHDLSTGGMLIETQFELDIGEEIEVTLPRTGVRKARVIWSSGQFFGCEFTNPVPPAAISAALLMATPEVSTPSGGTAPVESNFAARLAALRNREGWTLDDLASRLGVSRQAVWYWETGQRVPRSELFRKISEAFRVPEQDLIGSMPEVRDRENVVERCKRDIAAHFSVPEDAVQVVINL